MKSKIQAFTESYSSALHKYCRQSSITAGLVAAQKLGTRAVKLGISTRDLVIMHQELLLTVGPPTPPGTTSNFVIQQGALFFAEVSTAADGTSEEPKSTTVRLRSIIKMLSQRTKDLATSNEKLEAEILQRESIEQSLRISEESSSKLLVHSQRLQEELRQLSRRLLLVQEEERKRISRELHDVVAQALAGLHVRLSAVNIQSALNAKELQKQIDNTQRLVKDSVDVVQRFARDLRPAALDDLGILPALRSYVEAIEEKTGLEIEITSSPGVEKLSIEEKTVLYRIAQESICNILLHAKATHVNIRISHKAKELTMDVTDNGIGFEVDALIPFKDRSNLGLLGMRERVEMVGGTFCVESTPGSETTVRVTLPYPDQKSGSAKKASTKQETLACQ